MSLAVSLAVKTPKEPLGSYPERLNFELELRVEHGGFEPPTPCLPGKCSPAELMPPWFDSLTGQDGGRRVARARTASMASAMTVTLASSAAPKPPSCRAAPMTAGAPSTARSLTER